MQIFNPDPSSSDTGAEKTDSEEWLKDFFTHPVWTSRIEHDSLDTVRASGAANHTRDRGRGNVERAAGFRSR